MSDARLADMFSGIQWHGQRLVALTVGSPLPLPGLSLPFYLGGGRDLQ